MKKWNLIAAFFAFLLPLLASGQVVTAGIGAGYSLNNEVLRSRGSSTATLLGYGHGFYAGPQVDFALKNGFSIRTGIHFRKGGSVANLDVEKLAVNFAQLSEDLGGLEDVKSFLESHPELEIGGFTSAQALDFINRIDEGAESGVGQLKGTDLRSAVDRYGLNFPLLLRYTYGPLGVYAGVNLNVLLFNQISMKANLPGGLVYSDKDLESILPYAHAALGGGLPTIPGAKMSPEKFYREDIARPVSMDVQFGLEYAFSDWVSLQAGCVLGATSLIKAPMTDVFLLRDLSFQVGLVYHFHSGK